jgi:hypothetical protein
MALPKGFRNDIKLVNPKVGLERRQEMVDFLSEKNTFQCLRPEAKAWN